MDLEDNLRDLIDPEASRCKCCHCDAVETDGRRFDRCARCKVAKYCSRDCQKAAWPSHKRACERTVEMTKVIQTMKEREPDHATFKPDGLTEKRKHEVDVAREAERRGRLPTPRERGTDLPPPPGGGDAMDVSA